MRSSRKGLLILLLSLPCLALAAAAVYMVGMETLEENPRTFLESFSWAAETLSTTGYGADTRWRSPWMVAFVVLVQFIGVFLVFLIFPIVLIPFLEERFETRLPQELSHALSDHLVVFGFGPAVSTLVEQADTHGLPTVVIEEDESVARRLVERGQKVIHGRLDDGVLDGVHLESARALVVNSTDEGNAAVILAARQMGFVGKVFTVAEEPFHRRPLHLAGADAVFTPRHMLGAALAARASDRISGGISGVQQIGSLQVYQLRVAQDSSLAGRTVGQEKIGERTGAVLIGQWVGGTLDPSPTADTVIEPGSILVVAGTDESIARLTELTTGTVALTREGPFLVGGYGEVGQKVAQLLRDVGEDVVVVSLEEAEGVDVVGDILDPTVYDALNASDAQAVILALNSDAATLFATVIVKDAVPNVPVIARVNQVENVQRMHLAGADFALSISQVSGQILARRILGEESVGVDAQLRVFKTRADGLGGRHPAELGIRERTGCSVVAVERQGGDPVVEMGPDFRFEVGDTVYLAGSTGSQRVFKQMFG